MIEPFHYQIQAVAYERDPETGRVVRAIPAEPFTVYSADEAHQAITMFETNLKLQQQTSANGAVPRRETAEVEA